MFSQIRKMPDTKHNILLTVGDAGGVGPHVLMQALKHFGHMGHRFPASFTLVGDQAQCERLAARYHVDLSQTEILNVSHEGTPAPLASPESGMHQWEQLQVASRALKATSHVAVVTGPVNKHAVTLAGHHFVGQTEYFAREANLADDDVTMMFLGERLKTALVTTHAAIAEVPSLITTARITRTLRHAVEMHQKLRLDGTIAICGLNPHAGEHGQFGGEERLIASALSVFEGKHHLVGPMGAESAYRLAAELKHAAVVAMYHDQATIASKLLDFGYGTNVTWGLPFVRTSVDHGTAYECIQNGDPIDERGYLSAIRMCLKLLSNP